MNDVLAANLVNDVLTVVTYCLLPSASCILPSFSLSFRQVHGEGDRIITGKAGITEVFCIAFYTGP